MVCCSTGCPFFYLSKASQISSWMIQKQLTTITVTCLIFFLIFLWITFTTSVGWAGLFLNTIFHEWKYDVNGQSAAPCRIDPMLDLNRHKWFGPVPVGETQLVGATSNKRFISSSFFWWDGLLINYFDSVNDDTTKKGSSVVIDIYVVNIHRNYCIKISEKKNVVSNMNKTITTPNCDRSKTKHLPRSIIFLRGGRRDG